MSWLRWNHVKLDVTFTSRSSYMGGNAGRWRWWDKQDAPHITTLHHLRYPVVLTLTRIIKSVVTEQAPVTLELRNTPGKSTNNQRWYTHISQLTQFMPPPAAYKSEIGSQSTMCQVHTGAYILLLTPGETDYLLYRSPPEKDYHVYEYYT